MNKFYLVVILFWVTILLSACGSAGDVVENQVNRESASAQVENEIIGDVDVAVIAEETPEPVVVVTPEPDWHLPREERAVYPQNQFNQFAAVCPDKVVEEDVSLLKEIVEDPEEVILYVPVDFYNGNGQYSGYIVTGVTVTIAAQNEEWTLIGVETGHLFVKTEELNKALVPPEE